MILAIICSIGNATDFLLYTFINIYHENEAVHEKV